MTTTKQDQSILAAWRAMSEEGKKKKFKLTSPAHQEAIEVFMQHADEHYRKSSNTFLFLAGHHTAITFSKAAVQHALAYRAQTAQALAKLVTVENFQDRSRQAAIITLIQLVQHLEAPPKHIQTKA
jgi:hypothetical protein